MREKSLLLIVDDEPIAQMTMKALLHSSDYRLEFADNGYQALEKVALLTPDLIILDVMLPGMDGYEVCAQIRSNLLLADIPIMMVTSLEDRESRLRGFRAGAEYFISKPFDTIELQTRVRTVTQLNRYRHLQEELEKAYDLTLEGMVKALGQRHKETEAHTRHLVIATEKLARRMGYPESSINHLRRGALLHDVGKIGIPDAIHLKEGALTEKEQLEMQKHPQLVYDMLKHIDYLQPALEIAYCHHEKWDGTGYPRGLKGEEIPYSARLFAIVDVWEALSNERFYRPEGQRRWPIGKVIAYLREQSGYHFDAQFVEPFVALLEEEDL
jgi:putative two-component system response regulator